MIEWTPVVRDQDHHRVLVHPRRLERRSDVADAVVELRGHRGLHLPRVQLDVAVELDGFHGRVESLLLVRVWTSETERRAGTE